MRAEPGWLSRRAALTLLIGAGAAACATPRVQRPLALQASGPRLSADALIASDGARLPLRIWNAASPEGQPVEPWAVIVGLHGMDDYSAGFQLPGAYWAARGVTTYAYDQRGFGRAPGRGVWAGEALMDEDLRTAVQLVRARHPRAIVAVVGESMGGAVAITAFASQRPPDADRLILASPAVWGWREQGPANSALLWASAHLVPGSRVSAPNWLARRIRASDNIEELIRMGRDRNMIFATRIDALYGLVELMDHAAHEMGQVLTPTLFQYGAHDEIIPPSAAMRAARRLTASQRSAYYASGWHLLMRDLQRKIVLDDILAFIRDPKGALPSGAPPIPSRVRDVRAGTADRS